MTAALTDRWRPRTLADVRGQESAVRSLRAWLKAPTSGAFVFAGGTGVGKTSAAYALATELGVDVDAGVYGGLYEIASGEQTAASIRELGRQLEHWPMGGSGWRVCVVNEADCVSTQAQYCWLDVLEHLPERTVVIFTTNKLAKMPSRWRDRCEVVKFQARAVALRDAAEQMVRDVWARETGRDDAPAFDALKAVTCGNLSFRRLLQRLAPMIREAQA